MTRHLQQLYARLRRFYAAHTKGIWSAVIAAVAIALLLIWAYHSPWTGLGAHYGPPKDKAGDRDYFPAKTGWDWLQLLVIPVALAVVGIIVNRTDKRRERPVRSNGTVTSVKDSALGSTAANRRGRVGAGRRRGAAAPPR